MDRHGIRTEEAEAMDLNWGNLEQAQSVAYSGSTTPYTIDSQAYFPPQTHRPRSFATVAGMEETQRGIVLKTRGCLFDRVEYRADPGGKLLVSRRAGFDWVIETPERKKVAVLKSNFIGSRYTLKRELAASCDGCLLCAPRDVITPTTPRLTSTSKCPSLLPAHRESLHIRYTGLDRGSGPRMFQVYINPRDKAYAETLTKRVKEKKGRYIQLRNKQPVYHPDSNTYSLDFGGRVTVSSARNFQVIHPGDASYITLMFGKVGNNEYILDHKYPWCALDAFGVALSALGVKLGCEE